MGFISSALSGVGGFLANAVVWVLRSMVFIAGFAAVFIIFLIPVKLLVGFLSRALGIDKGGKESGFLKTVDRGINGIFTGVGTVFSGVANTAGMVRDKALGRPPRQRFGKDKYDDYGYGRRGRGYGDDYVLDERGRPVRRGRGRYNQSYEEEQTHRGKPVGDPRDKSDPYFGTKRVYDDYGFDQYGYTKDGRHKTILAASVANQAGTGSNPIRNLMGYKKLPQEQIVKSWMAYYRGDDPLPYPYPSLGLTYAALYSIGKVFGVNNVPMEWRIVNNKESRIKSYHFTEDEIQFIIDNGDIYTSKEQGVYIDGSKKKTADEISSEMAYLFNRFQEEEKMYGVPVDERLSEDVLRNAEKMAQKVKDSDTNPYKDMTFDTNEPTPDDIVDETDTTSTKEQQTEDEEVTYTEKFGGKRKVIKKNNEQTADEKEEPTIDEEKAIDEMWENMENIDLGDFNFEDLKEKEPAFAEASTGEEANNKYNYAEQGVKWTSNDDTPKEETQNTDTKEKVVDLSGAWVDED